MESSGNITVGFKFTNEFGETFSQESTVSNYDGYETDNDIMGRLLNAFLSQIGYVRDKPYILMEDVSEVEREQLYDYLMSIRRENEE